MRKTLIGLLIGIAVFGVGVWADPAVKYTFLYPKPALRRVFAPGVASRVTEIVGQPGEGYLQSFKSNRGEHLKAGLIRFETAYGAKTALADIKRFSTRQIDYDPHFIDTSGNAYERLVLQTGIDAADRYAIVLYDGDRTCHIIEAPNRFVLGDFEAYLTTLNDDSPS